MSASVESREGVRGPHPSPSYRWVCVCGDAGRWTRQPDTAEHGRVRHERSCDVFEAGPWSRPWNSGHANPLPAVTRADGTPLEFDPPNVLFIPGGSRLRMENYSTDRPILAVERFDGTIERYRMRPAAAATETVELP